MWWAHKCSLAAPCSNKTGHSLQDCAVCEGGVGGLDGGQGGLVLQPRWAGGGAAKHQPLESLGTSAGAGTVQGQSSIQPPSHQVHWQRQARRALTRVARADRPSPGSSCVTRHLHNKPAHTSGGAGLMRQVAQLAHQTWLPAQRCAAGHYPVLPPTLPPALTRRCRWAARRGCRRRGRRHPIWAA